MIRKVSPTRSLSHPVIWSAAWIAMLLVAMTNGLVRDLTYGRQMDALLAHQLSTLSGCVLLGGVIRFFVRRWPPASSRQALAAGLGWMVTTIAFEFVFFHFVGGHSWAALLANYNLFAGRVWVLLLLWIAIAPAVFFRLQAPKRSSTLNRQAFPR